MEEFVCKCGKKFDNKKSLAAHGTHCKLYEKKENKPKYKISENLYRCECGKEFNNSQSINSHFSHCEEHRKILGKQKREYEHTNHWENLSNERKQEIGKKSAKTYSDNIKNGTTVPFWKGKTHTEETKDKIRKAKYNYWKTVYNVYPNYNKIACAFINQLNEEKCWNLQHAENGGEFEVCGYFLDGYDKELNIAFEYDEPKHYTDIDKCILRKSDLKRQNKIISILHCTMYRYNEKLKLLYKVN